jgi:3-deoxy-D-manno-octulosonic-acid transferase
MSPPGLSARILAGVWALIASLLAPLLPFYLRRRAIRGKEITERLPERRGQGAARPPGRLIWCHAASNGETLSLLPLLEALARPQGTLIEVILDPEVITTRGTLSAITQAALARQ